MNTFTLDFQFRENKDITRIYFFRTTIILRGRKDKFVEVTETLDSGPTDILIAFGGYLGLFAGKSLLDFILFIIYRVFKFKNLK